ncbi:Aste57867_13195 [Aphanomyces stellatus]|uniref:Aste57867_13195 protein n=1 Tax=Aphanomyces stellatus TaxID=120398 RepID=A0A485KXZ2_9STRA|nr:hypothetical protein As57867_013146 [Aphanomyces stellatus]VFT90036.1 Aste57867_13195 [Aphanomyces stellatus]
MKNSRPRVDLRIVVDEPESAESKLAAAATAASDAWWLSGYRLPPPGHLGAHSVPVDNQDEHLHHHRPDVFTTPTQASTQVALPPSSLYATPATKAAAASTHKDDPMRKHLGFLLAGNNDDGGGGGDDGNNMDDDGRPPRHGLDRAVPIPSLRREQRRGAVLPSIASLISISPPTAKRSASAVDAECLMAECRAVKHFKLL